MRRLCVLLIPVVLLCGCSKKKKSVTAPPAPSTTTLISYPSVGTGGDGVGRAFYIQSYPGTSLSTVTLWFSAGSAGSYTFRLIARAATFDGTVIDSARSTFTLPGNVNDSTRTTFSFSNRSVTKNSTVTFTITLIAGPSTSAFFGVFGDYGGLIGAAINVFETESSAPPLDTNRRTGIPIILTGAS